MIRIRVKAVVLACNKVYRHSDATVQLVRPALFATKHCPVRSDPRSVRSQPLISSLSECSDIAKNCKIVPIRTSIVSILNVSKRLTRRYLSTANVTMVHAAIPDRTAHVRWVSWLWTDIPIGSTKLSISPCQVLALNRIAKPRCVRTTALVELWATPLCVNVGAVGLVRIVQRRWKVNDGRWCEAMKPVRITSISAPLCQDQPGVCGVGTCIQSLSPPFYTCSCGPHPSTFGKTITELVKCEQSISFHHSFRNGFHVYDDPFDRWLLCIESLSEWWHL